MIIAIDRRCEIQVSESTDFKKFKLVIEGSPKDVDVIQSRIGHFVTFESPEVAWISAEGLFDWPDFRGSQEWRANLEIMIAKARPHGWIKDDPLRIKSHIEWT